jgi:hypothetical protein
MEDANFARDRLHQAGTKLAERVEALKALEADRRMRAEHEGVLAERDRLAEEMERMAGGTEGAYRRGTALERRRVLMEQWSAHCSGTQPAANVVKLRA